MRHPVRAFGPCFALLLLAAACGADDPKDSTGDGDAGVVDPCIPAREAGDHVFTCNDLTFLTKVDESCLSKPCGLILDVHGFSMSGQQMRDNTELHELAPKAGYITVHPSAPGAAAPGDAPKVPGGLWTAELYPHVLDFVQRTIRVFDVDPARVHVTGFSQGGVLTWWFVCNHSDLIASAAPNAAAGIGDAETCVNEAWQPRIPLLYMNGETDTASRITASRELIAGLQEKLELDEGTELASDAGYTHTRYTGSDGMLLEYVEHRYGGQQVLAGHCIPGGVDIEGAPNNYGLNATTCTEGEINIHWGEMVLEFFKRHPKPAK